MEIQIAHLVMLYMILLGPLKLVAPFARATANADKALLRQIATRAAFVSTLVCVVVAGLGGFLMTRFHLSVGTLTIVMGAFLLQWAFVTALELPGPGAMTPEEPTKALAVFPVSLPGIIPPQGLALLILSADLVIQANTGSDLFTVMTIILIVMGLNWLFMIATPFLMKGPGPVILAVLSRSFAVVIATIAVQIILFGLRDLGIVA